MPKTTFPTVDRIKESYFDLSLTVPEVIKELGFNCSQPTFNKFIRSLGLKTRGKGKGNKPTRLRIK